MLIHQPHNFFGQPNIEKLKQPRYFSTTKPKRERHIHILPTKKKEIKVNTAFHFDLVSALENWDWIAHVVSEWSGYVYEKRSN